MFYALAEVVRALGDGLMVTTGFPDRFRRTSGKLFYLRPLERFELVEHQRKKFSGAWGCDPSRSAQLRPPDHSSQSDCNIYRRKECDVARLAHLVATRRRRERSATLTSRIWTPRTLAYSVFTGPKLFDYSIKLLGLLVPHEMPRFFYDLDSRVGNRLLNLFEGISRPRVAPAPDDQNRCAEAV